MKVITYYGGVAMSIEVAQITLSKGFQFTLPAKSRKKHGWKPGQKIQVIDLDKEIILRPVNKYDLRKLAGKFKEKKGFDSDAKHDIIVAGFD